MKLIISPKTTESVIEIFTDVLELRKVEENPFWHGNFHDSFYEGLNGLVNVLFTGYSGAVTGQALLEYDEHYKDDSKKEVYFVGSVYAFRDSKLEPGDLVYARDTFSPDSFEQSIYKNAKARGVKNITMPHRPLLTKVFEVAEELKIKFSPTNIYCCITPGFFPNFKNPTQLMNKAMWWKMSLCKIGENGFDSGEYESASVLATSKLLGIPAVALLDVKDKRLSENDYRTANSEQKTKALYSILNVIKGTVQR
jgi:purine-nucleoside phosphorylase